MIPSMLGQCFICRADFPIEFAAQSAWVEITHMVGGRGKWLLCGPCGAEVGTYLNNVREARKKLEDSLHAAENPKPDPGYSGN